MASPLTDPAPAAKRQTRGLSLKLPSMTAVLKENMLVIKRNENCQRLLDTNMLKRLGDKRSRIDIILDRIREQDAENMA